MHGRRAGMGCKVGRAPEPASASQQLIDFQARACGVLWARHARWWAARRRTRAPPPRAAAGLANRRSPPARPPLRTFSRASLASLALFSASSLPFLASSTSLPIRSLAALASLRSDSACSRSTMALSRCSRFSAAERAWWHAGRARVGCKGTAEAPVGAAAAGLPPPPTLNLPPHFEPTVQERRGHSPAYTFSLFSLATSVWAMRKAVTLSIATMPKICRGQGAAAGIGPRSAWAAAAAGCRRRGAARTHQAGEHEAQDAACALLARASAVGANHRGLGAQTRKSVERCRLNGLCGHTAQTPGQVVPGREGLARGR